MYILCIYMNKQEIKPICEECGGEIMQMTLTKRQYHNGVWYTLNDDNIEQWYRCEKCQAEYNYGEIEELVK